MKLARPLLLFLTLSLFTGLLGWKVIASRKTEKVHYHAGFQVYINGQKQDYSGFEHMHVKPCNTGDHSHANLTPEEKHQESGHLHDGIGTVVHVHEEGTTWGRLFRNLKLSFPEDQEIVAYGPDRIENIMERVIQPNESIVIVVGDQSTASAVLSDRVTIEEIRLAEGMSESCGAE